MEHRLHPSSYAMEAWMRRFTDIIGHVTGLLFLVMIILVTMQVGNRFTFKMAAPWTEELTRISYVALIFLGSVYAAIRSEHIRVAVLYETFPMPVRQGLHILFCVVSAGVMLAVSYGAYRYAHIGWTAALPTMQWLKMGYVQGLICVTSIAMAFAFASWAFRAKEPPRQVIAELE
jgi:TRAP-type C4-dicarboxylate transport system permease small subunit